MASQQHSPFLWKTSLQCTLSHQDEIPSFVQLLQLLQAEGFFGIELNLPTLDIISPRDLISLLQQYGLHLDMIATGAYARLHGLSLSDAQLQRRRDAVEACRENIRYAAQAGCGVILGFFKGGPDQGPQAREYLVESLRELSPLATERDVPILLEATNGRETSTARTLEETLGIVEQVGCPNIAVLADTYHVNLEEPPVAQTLCDQAGKYARLHISDDNRAFPGLGALDFVSVYSALYQSGFEGALAIEGNIQVSQLEDTRRCAAYLRAVDRAVRSTVRVSERKS